METPSVEDDAELAVLSAPRRRSPIVTLVVLALAGLLLLHLRADTTYAFRARTPRDLGSARTLGARGVFLEDNTHVVLEGQPDRRNALYVEPRGDKTRQNLYRLRGTGASVFVRAEDTRGRLELQDRWAGRLRRFDQVPYAASLRAYYAAETRATRYIDPEIARAALAGQGARGLRDRSGEPVSLEANAEVGVDVAFPDQLEVSLSRESFATADDARREVERLGLSVAPGGDTEDDFVFVVPAPPAERDAVVAKLEARELAFAAHATRLPAKFGELRATDEGLRVPGEPPRTVPWAAVRALTVTAPVEIPADAWLLTEGETPRALWWAPLIVALLVAFVAFNLWYLAASRRR